MFPPLHLYPTRDIQEPIISLKDIARRCPLSFFDFHSMSEAGKGKWKAEDKDSTASQQTAEPHPALWKLLAPGKEQAYTLQNLNTRHRPSKVVKCPYLREGSLS